MNSPRLFVLPLLLALAGTASAGTLTLSPAVVPLSGRLGQSAAQSLTLRNDTELPLAFVLEAKDVVVRDGRRVFVDAGELPDGIAATAVFSVGELTVGPGESRSVQLVVTLPRGAVQRAVLALFRGTTRIGNATASLGALLTFTVSGEFSLAAESPVVQPQTASANLGFQVALANDGREPLVPKGVAVILDARGALVARVAFESRRLLPGERTTVRAEYPGELPAGAYRALATFEYEGRAATRQAEFRVP